MITMLGNTDMGGMEVGVICCGSSLLLQLLQSFNLI